MPAGVWILVLAAGSWRGCRCVETSGANRFPLTVAGGSSNLMKAAGRAHVRARSPSRSWSGSADVIPAGVKAWGDWIRTGRFLLPALLLLMTEPRQQRLPDGSGGRVDGTHRTLGCLWVLWPLRLTASISAAALTVSVHSPEGPNQRGLVNPTDFTSRLWTSPAPSSLVLVLWSSS